MAKGTDARNAGDVYEETPSSELLQHQMRSKEWWARLEGEV